MITDSLENRRVKELEKRIADLERMVGWVTGLLIDFVAVVIAIGAAIFVAGDYYRLSAVDGSVVLAFMVTMLALNFIFRKVARSAATAGEFRTGHLRVSQRSGDSSTKQFACEWYDRHRATTVTY